MTRFWSFLCCMMSWVCVNAQTQNTIVLQKETDLLLVGKSLYFLEDKEGKMTIEDVLKADKQGKFQHNDKDVFVRTNTPYKYWFKIVNQNKSKEDAWLEVGSTFMWNIDFYAPDSLQKYNKPIAMGSLRPYSNKLHNTNLTYGHRTRLRSSYGSGDVALFVRQKSTKRFHCGFFFGCSGNYDFIQFICIFFSG
jgi:7TMR-DISM extracellular 2